MPLSAEQTARIEQVIKDCLRKKFQSYKPETTSMPFHFRLLGRDRMALYSFIHSLNTAFGKSIFEPVAQTLAAVKFPVVETQFAVGNIISEHAQTEIQHIMNKLTTGNPPDKIKEISRIRAVCRSGRMNTLKTPKVDLFLQDENGGVHLFDIKTAKPNISNFKDFKRTLLEWVGIYLHRDPEAKINSYIAIPYNPYDPQPYERWTLKGMLDLEHELKVAEEFWDFLGSEGAYNEVLVCFERAGLELRPEIDTYFSNFK